MFKLIVLLENISFEPDSLMKKGLNWKLFFKSDQVAQVHRRLSVRRVEEWLGVDVIRTSTVTG